LLSKDTLKFFDFQLTPRAAELREITLAGRHEAAAPARTSVRAGG
jgi:hypothetical protein